MKDIDALVIFAITEVFWSVEFSKGTILSNGPVRCSIGPGWAEVVFVTGAKEGIICSGYVGGRAVLEPVELKEVFDETELQKELEKIRERIIASANTMLSACKVRPPSSAEK